MNRVLEKDERVKAVDELVAPFGMKCIELSEKKGKSSLTVSAYFIHCDSSSVTTDDLDNCYNAIYPYFQMSHNMKDVFLEVSSAGLERKINDVYEFVLFKGRGVRVYDSDRSCWISGIIGDCDDSGVSVIKGGDSLKIGFDNIKKANLTLGADFGDGEKNDKKRKVE